MWNLADPVNAFKGYKSGSTLKKLPQNNSFSTFLACSSVEQPCKFVNGREKELITFPIIGG